MVIKVFLASSSGSTAVRNRTASVCYCSVIQQVDEPKRAELDCV